MAFQINNYGIVSPIGYNGPQSIVGPAGKDGSARELAYAGTQTPFSTTSAYDVVAGFVTGLSVTVVGEGLPVEVITFFCGAYSQSAANRGVIPYIANGADPIAASTVRSPVTSDGPPVTLSARLVLVKGQSYTFRAGIMGSDVGTSNVFSGPVNTSYISVMAR